MCGENGFGRLADLLTMARISSVPSDDESAYLAGMNTPSVTMDFVANSVAFMDSRGLLQERESKSRHWHFCRGVRDGGGMSSLSGKVRERFESSYKRVGNEIVDAGVRK